MNEYKNRYEPFPQDVNNIKSRMIDYATRAYMFYSITEVIASHEKCQRKARELFMDNDLAEAAKFMMEADKYEASLEAESVYQCIIAVDS